MKKTIAIFLMLWPGPTMASPRFEPAGTSPCSRLTGVHETMQAQQVKAKVEGLGAGAEVRITLKDHKKLKGRIERISGDAFGMAKGSQVKTIPYDDVSNLELASLRYEAKGQIDSARVRQVIFSLQPDRTAKVRLRSKTEIYGHVLSVDTNSFLIFDYASQKRITVLFDEVIRIEGTQGSNGGTTKALWIGLIAALSAIIIGGMVVPQK